MPPTKNPLAAPTLTPEQWIAQVDPRLGRAISSFLKESEPLRFKPSPFESHFDAVARSIVFQQLSTAAARTIHGRFQELTSALTPGQILKLSDESLRGVGLSAAKVKYIKGLCQAVHNRDITLEGIEEKDDSTIIEILTQIPGIGVWSAQMFLMFRLHRPDVLPVLDLGVRKGFQIVYGGDALPSPKELEAYGERWAPWRSMASLYLWHAVLVESEKNKKAARKSPAKTPIKPKPRKST